MVSGDKFSLEHVNQLMVSIDQILAEAWMTMADSPCILYTGATLNTSKVIQASVTFSEEGNWQCLVMMPYAVAEYLSVSFYGEEEELDEELVSESVGEFINIIAGNLQGIIEEHSYLSIPEVVVLNSMEEVNLQGVVRNYSTPTGHFLIALNNLRQKSLI